ncbi:hypothetical protein T484DRAFT_3519459 [Baffinella frigidus]|nr:hypothetical protein T484DRAFT_3519459 [Cryptophyta sp. CCMP2293]
MSKVIKMRGLPFRASPDDIRAFFSTEPPIQLVNVTFETLPDGRPSGEALAEFVNEVEAERAMKFDRSSMGGRYVELMRAGRTTISAGAGAQPMDSAQLAALAEDPIAAAAAAAAHAAAIKATVDQGGGRERDRDSGRSDRDKERRRSRSRDRRDRDKDRGSNRDKDRGSDRDKKRSRSRDRERERKRSKSPPPRERKPKKKSNWDAPPEIPPEGLDGVAALDGSANPAVTYKARRIYIGNLPQNLEPPLTDVSLREFFDQAMFQAGLSKKAECCSDVWISAEKNFAFVEVHTIEEANNAMNLDGITFFGVPIRISRPHDYVTPAAGAMAAAGANPAMPGATGANVQLMQATKKARRIHVGNLPVGIGLTAQALKDFVASTMTQLSLTVKPDVPIIDSFLSQEGKFGFLEFRTMTEANNALALTGIELMGRSIRMSRPADYLPLTSDVLAQCEGSGILGTPGDAGVAQVILSSTVPDVDTSKATEVVVIKHMLSDTELGDDAECKEIAQDTIDKCQVQIPLLYPPRNGMPLE